MSIIGVPTEWADFIDPMVPVILKLVVTTWDAMQRPSATNREDDISRDLCRTLRQNRTARGLMFQIDTQVVELDPAPGEDEGRLDIAFRPLIAREDIYFCLECKRLNVMKNGQHRTYATEYVVRGMLRFIRGQYALAVRHGGMLAFVLDGNVSQAIQDVERNIRDRHAELRMDAPGALLRSEALAADDRARETNHRRDQETHFFKIHHLFMGSPVDQNPSGPHEASDALRAPRRSKSRRK
jgi:hypothetical protein